jgi:predicted permease
MTTPSDQTAQVLTTETLYQWINVPLAIALLFGLAGAFFLGIYILRRIRGKDVTKNI